MPWTSELSKREGFSMISLNFRWFHLISFDFMLISFDFFDFIWFPLNSCDFLSFLWFSFDFLWLPLVFFGFLWFLLISLNSVWFPWISLVWANCFVLCFLAWWRRGCFQRYVWRSLQILKKSWRTHPGAHRTFDGRPCQVVFVRCHIIKNNVYETHQNADKTHQNADKTH